MDVRRGEAVGGHDPDARNPCGDCRRVRPAPAQTQRYRIGYPGHDRGPRESRFYRDMVSGRLFDELDRTAAAEVMIARTRIAMDNSPHWGRRFCLKRSTTALDTVLIWQGWRDPRCLLAYRSKNRQPEDIRTLELAWQRSQGETAQCVLEALCFRGSARTVS